MISPEGSFASPTGGPATQRGRPRDAQLTQRFKDEALAQVSDHGFRALNVDRLAAATGGGKAGVYRRWPTTSDLVADALTDQHLVPRPPDTGTLHGDLHVLLEPFTRELTTAERAAASLVGPARHDATLAAALHTAVVMPVTDAVTAMAAAHNRRGHPVTGSASRLLTTLVLALWWERYLTLGPRWNTTELDQLIATTLLPVLNPISDN